VAKQLAITETRALWLAHLEKFGESAWSAMPKRRTKQLRPSLVDNGTWNPMINAGLITGEVKDCREKWRGMEWHFTLTDAGRAALAAWRAKEFA